MGDCPIFSSPRKPMSKDCVDHFSHKLVICLHIPGQVGHLFQSKLATHSDVKLAACSGAMLATFSDIPEWVAKMSPE